MKIKWMGQATFLIEYDDCKVLIDPWIRNNPVCPIELENVCDADVIMVTHGHFDHFGDSIELMERSDAKLVCSPEISWYMNRRGYVRGERLFPVAQGGAVQFGTLRVTMVPAIHPAAIYAQEWHSDKQWLPDSAAVGYILEKEGEPTLYHSGDTALFSDMSLFSKRYKPEIALLPIGGRFTMDALDAEEAIGFINCKYVIPMHYNTNPELVADEGAFKDAVETRYEETEVILLTPGGEHIFCLRGE